MFLEAIYFLQVLFTGIEIDKIFTIHRSLETLVYLVSKSLPG